MTDLHLHDEPAPIGYGRGCPTCDRWAIATPPPAVSHTHVLERCSTCSALHCACITCEESAAFMAADAEMLGWAQ